MNTDRLKEAAATVLLIVLVAACGNGGSVTQVDAETAKTSATPTPDCGHTFTDMSRIRANVANRASGSALSAKAKKNMVSADSHSYVARVMPADLAAAGIDANNIPADKKLLLFLSHGTWTPDELSVSRPLGNDQSTPPEPLIRWIIDVIDESTSQFIEYVYAPDSPCFRE